MRVLVGVIMASFTAGCFTLLTGAAFLKTYLLLTLVIVIYDYAVHLKPSLGTTLVSLDDVFESALVCIPGLIFSYAENLWVP